MEHRAMMSPSGSGNKGRPRYDFERLAADLFLMNWPMRRENANK